MAPQPRPETSRNELAALAELPFTVAADLVSCVEGVHQGVATRSFRPVGVLGLPARVVHDRVAGSTYSAIRAVAQAGGRAAAHASTALAPRPARELSQWPPGSLVVAALNGAFGDRFESTGNQMSIRMAVRAGGRDLAIDRQAIRRAFPNAGRRVALFVHGLCGDEHGWELYSRRLYGRPGVSYGSRLQADLGFTPVFVRYNTGRRVSKNGRALAALLEDLRDAWPTEIDQIALFGHSMGGLVVRSACHYGAESGMGWSDHVRHVFCLGSPHLGAPLEKAAGMAAYALALLPETKPFAVLLNSRSAGIKDLRFGSVVDEDWMSSGPEGPLQDPCVETPFLQTATYYFVAATVTAESQHPLGALVGDLLVRFPSASGAGRRRRLAFRPEHGRHVGGINHFSLLNHPLVYAAIRHWLEAPPPPDAVVSLELPASGGPAAAEQVDPPPGDG